MILRALFFQNNEELGEKGILGQAPRKKLAKTFPFRVSSLTILKKKIIVQAIKINVSDRSLPVLNTSLFHGLLNS
jgi:hypothetical protein